MDKINGVAGTLLINSGSLDSKKQKIDSLSDELSSFIDGYIKEEIFSTSSGESTKAFEDLLSSLNTSANTISSILKQTSAYINMINEDFKEIDQNQATNFNLT